MKPICVRFAGDNDYVSTVEAFVKLIAPVWFGHECGPTLTKESIARLFKELAFGLYSLHHGIPEREDRIRDYLKDPTILIGEEIESFHNWNGDGCLAYLQGDTIAYLCV